MNPGDVFDVTFRTVANRPDWTVTRRLIFCGLLDGQSAWEVPGQFGYYRDDVRIEVALVVLIEPVAS